MKSDVFDYLLEQINHQGLQKFTRTVLNSLDDEFYVIAASTSGKYHHQSSLGEGGLVRHIQRAAYFGRLLIDSQQWDADNIKGDILISAILLHDIGKKGEYKNYFEYVDHPITGAKMLNSFKGMLDEKLFKIVQSCVLHHMGVFGPKNIRKETYNILETFTYLADFMSSKKEIEIIKK